MSDELTGRPWAQAPWELVTADISAQAFRVAMAIQLHRRPDGVAPFPSQKRLAEMTHTSKPTVERAIKELVAAGILRAKPRHRDDGGRTSNSYSLHLPITREDRSYISGLTGDGEAPIIRDGTEVDSSRKQREGVPSERPRDEVWDALSAVTGIVPESSSERSRFGKVVKELKQLGATADEIKARAKRWSMKYPNATLTDTALINRWGELGQTSKETSKKRCDHPGCGLMVWNLTDHKYNSHGIGHLCLGCGKVYDGAACPTCRSEATG